MERPGGYNIAKQLGEKRSTVGAIIRKWKKLNTLLALLVVLFTHS